MQSGKTWQFCQKIYMYSHCDNTICILFKLLTLKYNCIGSIVDFVLVRSHKSKPTIGVGVKLKILTHFVSIYSCCNWMLLLGKLPLWGRLLAYKQLQDSKVGSWTNKHNIFASIRISSSNQNANWKKLDRFDERLWCLQYKKNIGVPDQFCTEIDIS